MLGILCALTLLASCSQNETNNAPPAPAASNTTNTPQAEAMETLRVLSAPKGLNTQRLFAEPVSDGTARFNRLEREVQDLRDDFDLVSPAITRLVAVEKDMRDLMNQLETLVASDTQADQIIVQNAEAPPAIPPTTVAEPQTNAIAAPTSVTQPIVAPVAASQPAPAVAAASGINVKDLRIGEHADKTRIVLDMSGEVPFTATVNGDGMGMVVTFPGAGWQTDASWSSDVSPLVRSYTASATADGGTRLDVTFAEKASLKYKGFIKPRNDLSRLVLDLYSPDLHLAQ